MRYTLMNKNAEVLEFDYDETQHAVRTVLSAEDLSRAPLAIWNDRVARFATWDTLASLVGRWWQRRGVPESRINLKHARRVAGFESPAQLTAATCGFSLADQYWARPEGSDVTWETGNFFLNDFDDGIGEVLAGIAMRTQSPSLASPSSTVDGNLPKMWHVSKSGVRELYKAGSGVIQQEPFNEVVATLLYGRLFGSGEFVPYRLEQRGKGYYSVCPCFVDADHEFVTARDLFWADARSSSSPTLAALVDAAERMGVQGMRHHLDCLFACDYILGNIDRHLGNFGIVRTQSDGAFERIAPIFDSGMSLLCFEGERDQDALDVLANPFLPRQSQQLALVSDFSWLRPAQLDGFADEATDVLRRCPSRYMDGERVAYLHAFIVSGIRTVGEVAALSAVDCRDMEAVGKRADTVDRLRERFLGEEGMGRTFVVR